MARATGEPSIPGHDCDPRRISVAAHALDDPVVCRGREVKPQPGLTATLRVLGRTTAIEDEPDLSVRIREAPGESDQALAHGIGPERSLRDGLRCFGLLGAARFVSARASAKRCAVEGVVSVDQPQPRFGEGIESAGAFIEGFRRRRGVWSLV